MATPTETAEPGALDLSCADDLDPNLRAISGGRAVAEAVYRELVTPMGRYWWDNTRGLGLAKWLNVAQSPGMTGQIEGQIEACALNDERVDAADASVDITDETLTVSLRLTLTDGTEVRFDVATTALGSSLLYGQQ
jgi:hypothetical protein